MLNIDIESMITHREKIKIFSGIIKIKETTAINSIEDQLVIRDIL
jgi:4'-phosphopantetheinyl transferase EntD